MANDMEYYGLDVERTSHDRWDYKITGANGLLKGAIDNVVALARTSPRYTVQPFELSYAVYDEVARETICQCHGPTGKMRATLVANALNRGV